MYVIVVDFSVIVEVIGVGVEQLKKLMLDLLKLLVVDGNLEFSKNGVHLASKRTNQKSLTKPIPTGSV